MSLDYVLHLGKVCVLLSLASCAITTCETPTTSSVRNTNTHAATTLTSPQPRLEASAASRMCCETRHRVPTQSWHNPSLLGADAARLAAACFARMRSRRAPSLSDALVAPARAAGSHVAISACLGAGPGAIISSFPSRSIAAKSSSAHAPSKGHCAAMSPSGGGALA